MAINEAERYKSAVSNLETQAKLAESNLASIKNQMEQQKAQLDEAQVRPLTTIGSLLFCHSAAQARKNELLSSQPIVSGGDISRTSSAGGWFLRCCVACDASHVHIFAVARAGAGGSVREQAAALRAK